MLDSNLAWGVPILTRFDDFDLVSRSRLSQKYNLQIVFFIFSSRVV